MIDIHRKGLVFIVDYLNAILVRFTLTARSNNAFMNRLLILSAYLK
ncbi:MAG: hypothetical protein ACI93H_001289 [Psychromonas sp.]|jgi:hypothetical protein